LGTGEPIAAVALVYSSGLNSLPLIRVANQLRELFKWLGLDFGTPETAIRYRHDLATENLALLRQWAVVGLSAPQIQAHRR
jgi:hypothetical protein